MDENIEENPQDSVDHENQMAENEREDEINDEIAPDENE